MSAQVIAFPSSVSHPLNVTDQEIEALRLAVGDFPGDWRVDKVTLGADCAYALLIPKCWGDGSQGAFDICRRAGALILTDYRKTEFFGGCEDHQGTVCGTFGSVEAVCDALTSLLGTNRSKADHLRWRQSR